MADMQNENGQPPKGAKMTNERRVILGIAMGGATCAGSPSERELVESLVALAEDPEISDAAAAAALWSALRQTAVKAAVVAMTEKIKAEQQRYFGGIDA